jgi:hypothetical protein
LDSAARDPFCPSWVLELVQVAGGPRRARIDVGEALRGLLTQHAQHRGQPAAESESCS